MDLCLKEFLERMQSDAVPLFGGGDATRKALQMALGDDKARRLLDQMNESSRLPPFERVKTADSKTLAGFIKSEHPQTIAVILTHLPKPKAAEVLRMFPDVLQFEVVRRISLLETIPPGIIEEIDTVLNREVVSDTTGGDSKQLGGVEAVAELLNNADKATEERIFNRLEEEDPELAEQIRQLMFVFEDLINIDDRGIREVLKEVRNEDLTLSLKTCSEELRAKIMANLSERAAAMILEDLEAMGPVRVSEVEAAQQKVIQVTRKLEHEGKIVIGGKGQQDALV
jgi:flagellar motor switch protein FliG